MPRSSATPLYRGPNITVEPFRSGVRIRRRRSDMWASTGNVEEIRGIARALIEFATELEARQTEP